MIRQAILWISLLLGAASPTFAQLHADGNPGRPTGIEETWQFAARIGHASFTGLNVIPGTDPPQLITTIGGLYPILLQATPSGGLETIWSGSTFGDGLNRQGLGDVLGDAAVEVVFLSDGGDVVILDLAHRRELRFASGVTDSRALRVADYDRDGVNEILVSN